MRESISGWKTRFRRWQSECAFTVATVPNVLTPLAGLNNALDVVKNVQISPRMVKRGAATACEQARQACKYVDLASGTNTTSSWRSIPVPSQPQAQTQVPSWFMNLDKDQMLAVMNASSQRPSSDIVRDIEAAAAAARANRAIYGG